MSAPCRNPGLEGPVPSFLGEEGMLWVRAGRMRARGSWHRESQARLKSLRFLSHILILVGFPGGSDGKESACNAGDVGSIPGLGRLLEKGMASHSNILVWRIPWTEELGGLQSMGLQRVRND